MGYFRGILGTQKQSANEEQEAIQTLNAPQPLSTNGDKPITEHEASGWISNQSRAQNGKYPSPLLVKQIEIDEFSNWIADEMISTDAHVQSLMEVLQQHAGFQIRLYALQLLEAVVATRPIQAKECILNIPLAISTIVGLLDDPSDPIRNETILLLMALVNNNFNIQKLVAFENTFERIFEIIEEEGGIRGSILVQDCMTLLTNLLTYNASNQTFFLETDCVPKLANLIAEPIEAASSASSDGEDGFPIPAPPIVWTEQRLQNMSILLEICRSFVDPENQHLVQNQEKLYSSGIFFSILRLAFSPGMENPIRKTALQATGDIIANNAQLQLQFAHIDVPYVDPSMPLQVQKFNEAIPAPLALLNWAVLLNSVHIFEVRLAAMNCLAKFFSGNPDAKMAFLVDQIRASKNPNYYREVKESESAEINEEDAKREPAQEEEPAKIIPNEPHNAPYANIFTILTVFNFDVKLNPYSVWFSAITLTYLITDCAETRQLAREMQVGNADEGEEVMSSIQAISGMLVANLDNSDPRIAVGYLVLLTLWLYEDFDAVNDFLSDPTSIKSIVAFLTKNSTESSDIVLGMSAILVGVCYDFTTKTSPLPRSSLYELITKSLGADSYALKVKQFKNNPIFKQFDGDLEAEFERDSSGLPNLFFTPEYTELVKDNYYRIRKSLSRGPKFEPRSRISFEIFEELENQNVELRKSLEDLNLSAEDNEKALKSQVEESEAKLKETAELLEKCNLEINEARSTEEELIEKIEGFSNSIKVLEAEKTKFESSAAHYTTEFHKLSKKSANNEESLKQLKQKLGEVEAAKQKAEDGINKMSRELFQLTKQKKETDTTISNLEKEISKLQAQHAREIKDYQTKIDVSLKTNEELRAKLSILGEQSFKSVSPGDEKAIIRMRELQVKISEMEEANDNLMEKLRSAASVVSGLRADRSDLQKEKESLESELAKAYEDLEAFTQLLEEVEELKGKSEAATLPTGDLDSSNPDLKSVLEEKEKLEERLSESMKTIESLQSNLADERQRTEQEIITIKSDSAETSPEVGHRKSESSADNSRSVEFAPKSPETQEQEEEALRKLEELNAEISTLRSNLQESQSSLEHELTRHHEEVASLTQEHSELLAKHESLKEEYEKTIKELSNTAKNTKSTSDEEQYIDEIKKRDSELEISSKRIWDLERNIEVLSESANSSLVSFKNSQNSLKSRIEELEESKKSLQDEIEEYKQDREKLVEEFQNAYDDLDSAYMDLELSQTNLEKHKDDLEKQLKKLQEELTTTTQTFTTETETLRKALFETRTERDELRKEYYELEKSTNIIGSELQAKEALLQAISNKGADLAAKDKIVIEIKEKLAGTIVDLGESAQKLRVLTAEKSDLQKLYEENVSSSRMQNRGSEKTLESEIVALKKSLSDVNLLLDEQRKLNCDNSSAAVLEFTEKSTKLEKSILENQQLHEIELDRIRNATNKELEELKQSLLSLKDENKKLSEHVEESERLSSDAELKSNHLEKYKQRAEIIERELENSKASLKQYQDKLSERDSELKVKEEKMASLSDAHKEDLQKASSEISEMKSEIEKWRVTASEHDDQVKLLISEKEALFGDLQAIKKAQAELELVIQSEKASSASQGEASRNISQELEQKAVKLEEVESLYKKSEATLSENKLELERQIELLGSAQTTIKELEEKLVIFEKEEPTEGLIEDLKAQVKQLEEEVLLSKEHANTSASALNNGKMSESTEKGTKGSGDLNDAVSRETGDLQEIQKLNVEIETLKEKAQKELDEHVVNIGELKHTLAEKSEELVRAESKLSEEKSKLTRSVEELKQTQESVEQSLLAKEVTWKEQLEKAEETSFAKEKEIAVLREEIASLEEKLQNVVTGPHANEKPGERADGEEQAAVAKNDHVQEDFADLMMICDLQEQKLKKYKRKLRALEIPVSSDESDGEDLL
ncbi:hypothetical protein JCM33374_g4921 [Metschnikowia sp. JCM 33374]|nr:hypothetical protein JCM33374_g4921 [Metschnikowia sp. JCM 33374]